MNVLDILTVGSKIIDRVLPDPAQKLAAQQKLLELQQNGELAELNADLQTRLAQVEVNKIEAGSNSLFKSGWRPAVGWTCVGALIYQMIFRPIFSWIAMNLWGWSAPPSLEMDTLMTLLFGMLGLGAYRTVEKIKGKA